ncbi:MAG: cobalt-precorrin-5B (C(1))-methyltransferase CbiD [Salinivirgaceae bacterium]|jgi:cobalt-precorrin-5B (C1)-methyltransferase|nr:cobalt-precorrin-5B (C(1))-methyltransferase CbiD [Salinivirgaceae bacterium]
MNSKEKLHTELRSGLTTGTCASAVAKASAYMLIKQVQLNHVMVKLPNNDEVVLELKDVKLDDKSASCTTIKDAGDDPDITNGIRIIAKASFNKGNSVKLIAGEGIGIVTKPGLAVEVGKPAINPVPLKMINESLAEVVPDNTGVEVLLSIPEGVEVARKTFNPRLGIEGGISVLGTTGIVKPMSEEALKDSLILPLKQLAAIGCTKAILSPGNYGRAFSKQQFNYDEDKTVLTSNYIGYMLEQAVRHKFTKLVLIGHIGKLVKLAGGIFNTHSRTADARNEILAAHYFSFTQDADGFEKIMNANTTEEVVTDIQNSAFWNYLALQIKKRTEQYIYQELEIEIVLFSQKTGQLTATRDALNLIKEISAYE